MPAGKTENIKQVRLSQLFPFERHPFKVNNDAEILKIVESVKLYGVLPQQSRGLCRTAGTSLYPVTGARGPVSWRGWRLCR